MFFWLKPSTITVDCFTFHPVAFRMYPIQRAIKFIPTWWKKMPLHHIAGNDDQDFQIPAPTLKTCPGLFDLYKDGFVVPLWSDMILKNTESETLVDFADHTRNYIERHPRYQFDPAFENYNHIKINVPWCVVEKSGINWLEFACTWNLLPEGAKFHVTPGRLDFKLQHSTNVNCFLTKDDNKLVQLKAGTPLVHWIPLSEKKVKVKTHYISDSEYMEKIKLTITRNSHINSYRKVHAVLGTCPFKH